MGLKYSCIIDIDADQRRTQKMNIKSKTEWGPYLLCFQQVIERIAFCGNKRDAPQAARNSTVV